jgi:DNA adenine methylase
MTFTDFVVSSEIVRNPKTKQRVNSASPFIQWVGGKRSLIEKYNPYIPIEFNRYFEPFLGGGAMFYHLHSKYGNTKEYFLSDLNNELILVYKTIVSNHKEVTDLVNYMNVRHSKGFYYAVRNYDRVEIAPKRYEKKFDIVEELTPVEVAARFIYLNLTCFNALYRVNKDNLFNVPIGTSLKKDISDNGILKACADVLCNATITYQPYQNITPESGDFVFLDPPYAPLSTTSDFTSYTSEGFGLEDQKKLKEYCDQLNQNGVKFMLANSNCEFIRDLYQDYSQFTFSLNRTLNSKKELRKQITDNEIMVTNCAS